jgi:hypothetical protein
MAIASEAVALTVLRTIPAVEGRLGRCHTSVPIEVADIGLAIRVAATILTQACLRNALVVQDAPVTLTLTGSCTVVAVNAFVIIRNAP